MILAFSDYTLLFFQLFVDILPLMNLILQRQITSFMILLLYNIYTCELGWHKSFVA